VVFFFSSRRRHTRCYRDWSSDVCSSDLVLLIQGHGLAEIDIPVVVAVDQQDRRAPSPHGRHGRGFECHAGGVLAGRVRRRGNWRSEERRVGKEGRRGGGGDEETHEEEER